MAPRSEPQPIRPSPAPRLFSRSSHASKHSFRSHSSSFEADDERSSTASAELYSGRMSPSRSRSNSGSSSSSRSRRSNDSSDARLHFNTNGGSSPPARYPGEDVRPTSSKELAGWYTYAFAAEVYVVCGSLVHFFP